MIIRLSHRLKAQLNVGSLSAAPLDGDIYADWSARSFTADRARYILLSHTRSLYSVVMFGCGITHEGLFISRALDSIREFMSEDGLGLIYMNFLAPATALVGFRKPLNKSVTGSMNELEATAKFYLQTGEWSPFAVGFKLNETLFSALALPGTGNYATPREALKRLGLSHPAGSSA